MSVGAKTTAEPIAAGSGGTSLDLALSGGDLHMAASLFLVAPDAREADVRAQIARSAFNRISDLDISYLSYSALEQNRDAIGRFGSGLKAIRAVAHPLT